MLILLPMTDATKIYPKGLVHNLRAPFSGRLEENIIREALDALPEALVDLTTAWSKVGVARNSGVCFAPGGSPLDDAIRGNEWHPTLQHHMPVAGGVAGSRGIPQAWNYQEAERMPRRVLIQPDSGWINTDSNDSSFPNLEIFEQALLH